MSAGIAIVGAGQAALSCAQALRRSGVRDAITIYGDEPFAPYQRPPLSKAHLKEPQPDARLYLQPPEFYARNEIALKLGARVASLDVAARTLTLGSGELAPWGTLVLATGTRARAVPIPGLSRPGVYAVRGLADVEALRPALKACRRLVILGGGFIGLEVASVAADAGVAVTVIEAEDRVLKRMTSPIVSAHFASLHRGRGVTIELGARASAVTGRDAAEAVVLADGRELPADLVLSALGATPNVELAASAGLEVSDGIVVDASGRTSAAHVYACGDCTRFPSARFGTTLRLESVQNAIDQATAVAGTIAGQGKRYDPVPWFWSDQYDVKLQIAGLAAGYDAHAVEGEPSSGSFSVAYRRAGRLIAVDAINAPRAHMLARRQIELETAHETPH